MARKQRGLTEAELAARVGIARSTVQSIERGDPGTEIGLALEAATLTGVSLFVPDAATLAPQIAAADQLLTLLPRSARRSTRAIQDDV